MQINSNPGRPTGLEPSEFTPRQEQILDRALELIRAEGLAGMTMRKIAELMGFSEPAIYRHFATKQDLVLGIIRRLEIHLIGPMQAIAAETQRSVIERIGDILAHHLDLIADNNALPILLFAEAAVSRDPRLSKAMAGVFGSYEGLLVDLLKEGHEKREIDPDLEPADGAMILMGAPTACALRMRLLSEISSKARRERLVQYVKSGILSSVEVK